MKSTQPSTLNVRFAGLGGTGVIKASDIFADVAFRSGCEVKKAEVHGMSQRGGSVQSDVRFGTEVHSPMIPGGACDFLIVMEESQIEVVRGDLRAGGTMGLKTWGPKRTSLVTEPPRWLMPWTSAFFTS